MKVRATFQLIVPEVVRSVFLPGIREVPKRTAVSMTTGAEGESSRAGIIRRGRA
jgi:hypothetical protein